MKTVVYITEEQRQFLEGLLAETREQFARSFRELANNCSSKKDHRKLVAYWSTIADLAFCKNIIVEDRTDEEEQKGGRQ